MSAFGPSRHTGPPRDLGRKRGEAEVEARRSIAEASAFDPKPANGKPKDVRNRPWGYFERRIKSNDIT
jgi:hypothetical protein